MKIFLDIQRAFLRGTAFGAGALLVVATGAAVAVTVTGNMNTFSSGEVLDASKMNQNFASLKAAIEGIPTARVRLGITNGTVIGIPNGIWTAISWNEEPLDTANYHDMVVNPSRVTLGTTGNYLITARVRWASNGAGIRQIGIFRNGAMPSIGYTTGPPMGAGVLATSTVTTFGPFNAGEYLEVKVFQDGVGLLNIVTTEYPDVEFSVIAL